ncbi:MAG: amidase [Candidatus Bathyarchaeota archaeon]|nr:amidase [Candidatus Bathyarchaeota archaeon]
MQGGRGVTPVFTSIRELSEKIKNREVSPVELTETFLARLEEHGPTLNAVVTVTRERALKEAKKAEKAIKAGKYLGPLHGIPYGGKDLLATKGIPASWGAAPFKDQVFDHDATVVKKLGKAGSVLGAKLAMIELAGGMGYRQPNASFTGPCSTPWSLGHWAGGSSSGSGSAVAAGLVPFTIGSETWGSILSPAGNCGVAGLRPTYGRVSRHGAMALSWTLDKLGPLCLTADDCGLVLEAMAGYDKKDQTTTRKLYKYEAETREFRFGVLKGTTNNAQEAVTENFNESLKELENIGTVEEMEYPEYPYEAITRAILNAEAASAFDEFTEAGTARGLTAPEDHYGPYARTIILAKDYLKALRLRAVMAKKADKAMEPYDAIVAPGRTRVAPPIDMEFRKISSGTSKDIMGAIGNGAGLPSISVPNGFNEEGLPTSIQFMGRAYDENLIISAAVAYQGGTQWHTKHPKAFTP